MALDQSALRLELGKAFDKNAEGYLGPVNTNQQAKDRAVLGWANGLEACCDGITPPSTTLAAARAALETAMAGAFTDTTGATFFAAFQAFAAALATGMAPAFVPTPPPIAPVLSAPVPSISDALDTHAATIVTWLKTGTATPSGGGAPVNWA